MKKWTNMRTSIFTVLQEKYGTLSVLNHSIFTKEIKRLEIIWKNDPKQFHEELKLLKEKES